MPKLRFKKLHISFAIIFLTLVFAFFLFRPIVKGSTIKNIESKFGVILKLTPASTPVPTPIPTPTPSPTPRPLTFAELNALYGPCVRLPVLMYHHIQTKEAATLDKQLSLTVYTDVFRSQMQYLKDRGYNILTIDSLINFFDSGAGIPSKSVILTFDDGYEDFYTDAYPILSGLGFHATMFVPTGLMENPDYLTWGQISGMNGLVYFANHTWSHKNVQVSGATMRNEISTADTQLNDHGLNHSKVFAYPYGLSTIESENYLSSIGYKLAFTTVPGSVECKKQRFALPRIRAGNSPLSAYGF